MYHLRGSSESCYSFQKRQSFWGAKEDDGEKRTSGGTCGRSFGDNDMINTLIRSVDC